MKRGLFIVMEGLDRSGKTTQISLMKAFLKAEGHLVEEWSFPDRTTAIGQSCDAYLRNKQNMNDRAIHLMFSANRWEKEQTLINLIQSGTTIVCSRYAYSGVAYSGAKGLPMKWCRSCDIGLPEPDLVIFLDIDPGVAATRSAYGEERYEKVSFQKNARQKYYEIFEWDKRKICVVDACQSIDKVKEYICECIRQKASSLEKNLGKLWCELEEEFN